MEEATAGIADAIDLRPDGTPQIVIDWKSDVSPTPDARSLSRAGPRLSRMTGAERGLIVLLTTGTVISGEPGRQPKTLSKLWPGRNTATGEIEPKDALRREQVASDFDVKLV